MMFRNSPGYPALPALKPALRRPWLRRLALTLCCLNGIANAASLGGAVQEGIEVRVDVSEQPREGSDLRFALSLRDTATGAPLRGARPAAWLAAKRAGPDEDPQSCRRKASSFIGGSWLRSPALDLNAYYVLALNEDPSITVIDPLNGFGGSKLLALVPLRSPGEDWVQTPDQRLFVSMPEAGAVAVIDTRKWSVLANISIGGTPRRLAVQPGYSQRNRVWATDAAGVAAIDGATNKVAARIDTGDAQALAFSDDGRTLFVSNNDDGKITVIDAIALKKTAEVQTGGRPAAIAWSSQAQLAYVTLERTGEIAALDVDGRIAARMQAEPGLGQIRFAPGGRFAFALNPAKDQVHVIDAASNRIVQSAGVPLGPEQVAFSDKLAYIRRRGSEIVQLIPFDGLGTEGQPLQVASFSGGQRRPADGRRASPADAMVAVPNGAAALVANPADRAIYYYEEGMAAPMGSFANYSREPRAVLVVDRSLQEREPGLYTADGRLPQAGAYELVFFLESPRMLHCFPLTIEAPASAPVTRRSVDIRLDAADALPVGQRRKLQFRVSDAASQQQIAGIGDLQVLIFDAPGITQTRLAARETEHGIYSVEFVPREAGFYYVHFQSASLGLRWNDPTRLLLEAKE